MANEVFGLQYKTRHTTSATPKPVAAAAPPGTHSVVSVLEAAANGM